MTTFSVTDGCERRELRAELMNGEIGAVAHCTLNPACFIKGSTESQKNGNSYA
jgi:hypothetical protein